MPYYIKNSLSFALPTGRGNLSEVNLFEQMLKCFKYYYGATVIINKTHTKYVGFQTTNRANGLPIQNITREISDLHIITYSPKQKIARETYLQAKVANTPSGLQANNTFNFRGDWYQYDLLSRRPELLAPLNKPPYYRLLCDPLFLQDATLPSIGSYGVFYINRNKQVDFAYQPANVLSISSRNHTSTNCQFTIDTNLSKYNIPHEIPDLQYTYDADEFEYAVIHNLVGSPLRCVPSVHFYLGKLFHFAYRDNSEELLREVSAGLVEFAAFLQENKGLFFMEHQVNNGETLSRYRELNHFTEYGTLPEQKEVRVENDNRNDNLCKGSISLVLINTDKLAL